MNLWKTVALLGVFGVLLLYVLRFERGEAPDETANRMVAQLAGLKSPDEVTEITVQRPSGSFTVQRVKPAEDDGGDAASTDQAKWRLTAPLTEDCDSAADSFLDTVLTTKAKASYAADAAKDVKDADTGLDKPEVTLTLTSADGRKGVIHFGGKTPDQSGYYARVEGRQGLLVFYTYYVDTNLRDKKLGELRNKDLWKFAAADVQGIRLAYPSRTVSLKRDGAAWTIDGPKPLRADATAVDTLLSNLSSARIEEFVENADSNLKTYGLDKPRVEVELDLGAKGKQSLLLGATTSAEAPPPTDPSQPPPPPSERVYVQRKGGTEVLQAAGTLYDQVFRTPTDLRDKTVFAVSSPDVVKVRYTLEGQEVELVKQAAAKPEQDAEAAAETPNDRPKWQLTKPQAMAADSKVAEDLISTLELLRATDFVDEPKDLATYGLAAPRGRVEVEQTGGKTITVLIGKPAGETGIYVKRADAPEVMTVRSTFTDDLETKPNRLRDLSVVHFDRTLVTSIAIRQKDGALVVLQPEGGDTWKMTKPEEKDADTGRVGVVLTALEDLRGDEWVADRADNLAVYGLDKPDVTVTVRLKDGGKERVETIYVATDPGGGLGVFIKRKGHDPIYRSDSGLVLSDLRKGPDDFEPFEQPDFGGMGMPPM